MFINQISHLKPSGCKNLDKSNLGFFFCFEVIKDFRVPQNLLKGEKSEWQAEGKIILTF